MTMIKNFTPSILLIDRDLKKHQRLKNLKTPLVEELGATFPDEDFYERRTCKDT